MSHHDYDDSPLETLIDAPSRLAAIADFLDALDTVMTQNGLGHLVGEPGGEPPMQRDLRWLADFLTKLGADA